VSAPGMAPGDAPDVHAALAPQRAADLAVFALPKERGGAHALDAAGALHEPLGVRLVRAALLEEAAGELDGRDRAGGVELERSEDERLELQRGERRGLEEELVHLSRLRAGGHEARPERERLR